jgi:hypothetical protein
MAYFGSTWLMVGLAGLLSFPLVFAGEAELRYRPAPADNPLKGLVPYRGKQKLPFPHSMEFSYVGLGELVTGERKYDWTALEEILNDVASRGRQAIIRVYLEYPGKPLAVPTYLREAGLAVQAYPEENGKTDYSPDYDNQDLRRCLECFIRAFGVKYDGDPRLPFITAGLLGRWGEWHCHPRPEHMASETVQEEVMKAYEHAFKRTPVLLRYPAGPGDGAYVANGKRAFGYHDDSFAWATLNI